MSRDNPLESTMAMGLTAADAPSVGSETTTQLVVIVGPDAGRRHAIEGDVVIGRDADAEICVADDGVSRRHTVIRRSASGEFIIEDLGSRNGTYVNGIRIGTAPLRSGDKIAIGTGTILLFTYHDRYEEQVLQAQKLHLLGQLAGGIAHDFNNLIVTVLGNVTYLKDSPPGASEMADCLDEIESAARRAAELTAQLMSFARPQRRVREVVEVTRLVAEVVALLRRTVPRSLEIVTAVPEDIAVIGDPSQLLQVLMNGCVNAKQAMPHGGVLRIEAQRTSPGGTPAERAARSASATMTAGGGGDFVRITISDTGAGMDAATLARVFQPFFTTKPKGEGTGLGLATAYRIVRAHGGDVTMDSELGVGSRLVVTLPAANPGDTAPMTPEPPRRGKLKGRALVVDDEPLVRSTTRRMLERFGLEVAVAVDGLDAIAVQAQSPSPFQVAIVDLDMPNLDGEQAIIRMRAFDPRLRVVVASGHADTERSLRLRALGRVTILPKPFDADSLWRHVAGALEGATNSADDG
ncbi:MAG: response regulator [Deltaproteobacteria bacterium]|nr:response regulator [Deltaproteobacteria bacterium]MBK8236300.1 response regulator [Deltaproteobacteria bacterium]MBP7290920.1 response regulator [Nannocystaceae bacterium]